MRRVAILLAALCIGCGKPTGGTKIGLVTDVGGRGDLSFNDSALRGLENWAAGKKYEVSGYRDLTAADYDATIPGDLRSLGVKIEKLDVTPVVLQSQAQQQYEPNIQTLIEEGAVLVIGVGYMLKPSIEAQAKKNPKTRFLLIDEVVQLDNVASYVYKEHEGSLLVGAMAGLVTKTNVVSFVGGMEIPLIKKFEVGYTAGVRATNPKAQVLAAYTGKFDSPQDGSKVATDHIAKNADVLYHASGTCGLGVITEAARSGRFAIGVDSDQYETAEENAKKAVLTSMIKHVDLAVYEGIRETVQGRFKGGTRVLGLKEGGVGYAPVRVDIPNKAEVLARIEQLKKLIIEGKLVAPSTAEELSKFTPPK
jgi:basic membrane protein A